ncbi:MAG: Phosphonoacetaldehyde hydrolase [Acidobacteriota bacterium]
MDFRLAVFDMAGTTVAEGGAVYEALRHTLQEHGVEVGTDSIHQVKGTDKLEALRLLIGQSPSATKLLPQLTAIHQSFLDRLTRFYAVDSAVTEFPRTSETFSWLRARGIKVALNTGFSHQIARLLIDRLGWESSGLIDTAISSDEVQRGRPYPFMIASLMDRLGISEPETVIKIGDAPADLLEGYNAGCGLVVGVLGGSSTREQLEIHPHHYLIDSVADLPALLTNLGQAG